MAASNHRYHRGVGVDVWTNRGAWFWRLAGRLCGVGTIGSALTENEALREAQAAIEEVSARCARNTPQMNSTAAPVASHQPRVRAGLAADAADSSK
jgi:hypothetical protein